MRYSCGTFALANKTIIHFRSSSALTNDTVFTQLPSNYPEDYKKLNLLTLMITHYADKVLNALGTDGDVYCAVAYLDDENKYHLDVLPFGEVDGKYKDYDANKINKRLLGVVTPEIADTLKSDDITFTDLTPGASYSVGIDAFIQNNESFSCDIN